MQSSNFVVAEVLVSIFKSKNSVRVFFPKFLFPNSDLEVVTTVWVSEPGNSIKSPISSKIVLKIYKLCADKRGSEQQFLKYRYRD